ncbi:unnamed protein product, partial [Mesorhabditis belari]|uniref:PWI domain-containing protein n=1 Tax=Mesorhabditis belari TaxID=2138241 RepID=A0AAF3J315_9BILA
MGDAGFYRGTNADQDGRFSDKEKKLLRTMKFEDALERKINRSKINLDVIKPWVVMRLNEMLGIDDDVITEYVFTQLEEPELNPKIIQINITGFLNARRAREFMGELWSLLIEAEESEDGIPKSLIEKKLSELHSRDFAKKQTETKDNVAIKTAENDWKHRYTSLSGGVYTGPMIKRERDDRIYSDKDRERPRDDARDNVRERPRDDARDNVRERPRDDTRDNMTDDAHMSSGDEMEQTEMSAAEKASMDRKKRLLAMRSRINGVEMKEEDYQEGDELTKRSQQSERTFRNYNPSSEEVAKGENATFDYNIVEKEIAEHLEDTQNTELPEQIDPSTLQPKKLDWDLKRNNEKRLQKLERRTQRAIAEIIRERLRETGDLAAAFHASSKADEADEA